MNNKITDFGLLAIFYLCVFFVLREWLVPIIELTNTGYLNLFLLFIGLALVLSHFRVNFVLSSIIKIVYILWFVVHVYTEDSLFSAEAGGFLVNEIQGNFIALLGQEFPEITNSFRTFLFLILIWMLVYLIHHWVTVRLTIFYFFVMTVFFIAMLDTYSPYDGRTAIVRVVVLGLLMTGLLHVKRLMPRVPLAKGFSWYVKFLVPLFVVIIFTSSIAYLLPKADPLWPDPVPYIKSVASKGGIGDGGISKVGYGSEDSLLGGGFKADDSIVFTAWAPERQYWRVESKDTYTSKGWIQPQSSGSISYNEGVPFDLDMPIGEIEEESYVEIEMSILYPFIVQPYGIYSASTEMDITNPNFVKKASIGKIETYSGTRKKDFSEYDIVFREPTFSLTTLRETSLNDINLNDIELGRYLQLPEMLPERVKELAYEITKNRTSVYEKIRGIEGYFARSGFQYDQTNVAIPTEEEDYVDQFLFETKIGYCDNFSTSMVVMLRSVGIPARWVKGFSSGEAGQVANGMTEFIVTNNDAHSWVEAYLPGIGWMPFEPTIGFSGVNDIDFDVEVNEQERDELQPEEREQLEQKEKDEKKEQTVKDVVEEKEQSVTLAQRGRSFAKWLKENRLLLTLSTVVLVIAFIWLYKKRQKWLPKLYISMYRRKEADWSNFESSYQVLLKQLSLYGLKRQNDETLHVFAEKVDKHFGTDDMRKLTEAFEIYIYSEDPEKVNFEEMKESWEYLINRTTG